MIQASDNSEKRLEGRSQACEALLFSRFGRRKTEVGAKAIAQLKQQTETQANVASIDPALNSLEKTTTDKSSSHFIRIPYWRHSPNWLALAAGLTILITSCFYYLLSHPFNAPFEVVELKGNGISIIRNGTAYAARTGMELQNGDIVTSPQKASVILQATRNQSLIELGERSRLKLSDEDGKLELTEGRLRAVFHNQKITQICTPNGVVSMMNAGFILVAKSSSTWLKVQEGTVTMNRVSDGASLDVGPRQYTVSAPGLHLAALLEGERWQTPYQATQSLLLSKVDL